VRTRSTASNLPAPSSSRRTRSKTDLLLFSIESRANQTFRRDPNDNRDIPLQTLRDPSRNVICPVKLLFIQALRSGNLSSLDDALTQASLRRDRTIQWLYPERPVIPQLNKCGAFIAWNLPAAPGQINRTTKVLGQVAGLLAHIVSHDIRRGAARDLANLIPISKHPIGVATKEVAQVTGHSANSLLNGTTDRYVGEVEQDTYTTRAEQLCMSRKAPTIGAPYKKRRLANSEITTYCEENDIDPASKNGRQRASEALHSQRKVEWMESEKGQDWTASNTSQTSVSTPSTTSKRSATASASPIIATPASTTSSVSTTPDTLIDPRLLLLDGGDAVMDDAAAQRLDTILYDRT
jgi:hypothetical protein